MKKNFADILNRLNSDRDNKICHKLPEWQDYKLEYPSSISLEQCSSSAAASYKAEIIQTFDHKHITDLTGGLGVDSYAFSKIAGRVDYYERNLELAASVSRNFEILGANNIFVHAQEVNIETEIPVSDIIFADPARRNSQGRKVFLLEDCSPNILELLPKIMEKSPRLLLKLSPMADVSMLASSFGGFLKELHIVSIDAEVKEILCLLERGHSGGWSEIIAFPGKPLSFRFQPDEEYLARAEYCGNIESGMFLIEPTPAMMKSGAFKLISQKFALAKLAPSTHLYISNKEASPLLFKSYRIKDFFPLTNSTLKLAATKYPEAEVSARNLHINSEVLAAKMGIKLGGSLHMFGCSVLDSISGKESAQLFVTEATT